MKGWLAGGSRQRGVGREKRARPADILAPAAAGAPAVKAVKRETDEAEPWERMVAGDFTPVHVKWSGDPVSYTHLTLPTKA